VSAHESGFGMDAAAEVIRAHAHCRLGALSRAAPQVIVVRNQMSLVRIAGSRRSSAAFSNHPRPFTHGTVRPAADPLLY